MSCADQILEYNGVDLRQSTAEQAAYELAKPAEKVTILVQYNLDSKQIVLANIIISRFEPKNNILNTNLLNTFSFFTEYNLIKDQPGDSYFVRALFTRQPDYNDPQQLSFTKVRFC